MFMFVYCIHYVSSVCPILCIIMNIYLPLCVCGGGVNVNHGLLPFFEAESRFFVGSKEWKSWPCA